MDEPAGPLQGSTHPDPYPAYRRWREAHALHFDAALDAWVVLGANEVQEALAHPSLRVRPPAEPVPRALLGTLLGDVVANLVRTNDGGFHATHRPAVERRASSFGDGAVGAATRAAVADLAPRRPLDALLSDLPVQAMARLLGTPRADLDDTVAHVHQFTAAIAPGASAETIEAGQQAARALLAQAPDADLPTGANRIALMQQSLDATAGLIGNALVRVHAAGAPTAQSWHAFIEEVARWDPSVHLTRRFAAEDCMIAGQAIRAGQGLVVMLAAADRDPVLNEKPDAFRTQRPDRRSVGFGAGPHACPGQRIAFAIAAVAVPALLAHPATAGRIGAPRGYRPLANARIPVFGS